jgi:hypothetical protein
LLNRAYAEVAEHYGCLIDPARAAKPKDKPRVERVMQYVRDSFWRGRSFASLTDMQTRAISWCREVAGVRAHRSLDGASPLAVFDALEAPALLALPARPFELARWLSPKVAPDCHIMVDKVLYSVPWAHVGARTDTRVSETTVAVHVAGKLVKTWPKAARGPAPTRRTIHRRRSLSSPGIRSGAGPEHGIWVATSPSWWRPCSRCKPCTGCARPKG